jgi:phosphoglycerol transferase MdoB-like AlkP superfamily enzyme
VRVPQTTTNRIIDAAAVWIVWWPAIALTLLSFHQYAHIYLLHPYARGIALSDDSELSVGQYLYVFSGTIFTVGIVIPAATFLASYFVRPRVMTRVVLLLSFSLALLSYASLVSVASTGILLPWRLLLDSVIQGLQDPGLASHYVSSRSAIKMTTVLASICGAALLVRYLGQRELTSGAQKLVGFVLVATAAILPSAYVYANLSGDGELNPGFDFVTQQIVVFLQLQEEASSAFDGLEIDQAISLYQSTVRAPQGQARDRYSGAESGSNLILISLETTPQSIVGIDSLEKLENLRKLGKQSFVSRQHYSTYPYTSDALFSMLTAMYPNNLRRHLYTETSLALDNNLDSRRIGLFNALNRSGYFAKVYMPNEFVFESDRAMFFMLGADEVFVSSKKNSGEQQWKSLAESTARDFPNYERMSDIDKQSLQTKLADDIAGLDQLLFDIEELADSGTKFCALFLPNVGHGPWPNQLPERTLLETGTDILLLQDKWIGQIVQTLEDAEIADSTVIVVTSDHGLRTVAEYPDLKPGVLNDVSFRVPLIVYAPNALSEHTYIEHVTSHIDVVPTILSLLGIEDSLIYMLGSPVWDDRIANRRTYFLANDYLGVDGYFEYQKFYMYRPMANATLESRSMYLPQSDAFSIDAFSEHSAAGDNHEEIVSDIQFQKSFQSLFRAYLLEPN